MMTKAELLLSTPQTIFTVDDLAVLWQISDRSKLWEIIKYYVRTKRLHSIHRGVYARTEEYSPYEAAVKLFPPVYISFTTALAYHGALFQYSSEIHAVAQASKRFELANGQVYIYHQLRNDILMNHKGVEKTAGYWIASLERAICDTSYLVPSFTFEYLSNVDLNKLEDISKLYGNAELERRIMKIIMTIAIEA